MNQITETKQTPPTPTPAKKIRGLQKLAVEEQFQNFEVLKAFKHFRNAPRTDDNKKILKALMMDEPDYHYMSLPLVHYNGLFNEDDKRRMLHRETDDPRYTIGGEIRRLNAQLPPPPPPPMKKGGEIKKTGVYKLHKGEIVVPANRVKSVETALKKSKMKPLKK